MNREYWITWAVTILSWETGKWIGRIIARKLWN